MSVRHDWVGERIGYYLGESALGTLLVASSEAGLCMVAMGDSAAPLVEDLEDRFHGAYLQASDKLAEVHAAVAQLTTDPKSECNVLLDLRGSEFQCEVWQALQAIPAGETWSYQQLAESIGRPSSSRAVANACAMNRLALVVPCHRVIGSDGKLHGFRWGVKRKRALLALEEKRPLLV